MRTKYATRIRAGIILGRRFRRCVAQGNRKGAMATLNDALKLGNLVYEAFDRTRLK